MGVLGFYKFLQMNQTVVGDLRVDQDEEGELSQIRDVLQTTVGDPGV